MPYTYAIRYTPYRPKYGMIIFSFHIRVMNRIERTDLRMKPKQKHITKVRDK